MDRGAAGPGDFLASLTRAARQTGRDLPGDAAGALARLRRDLARVPSFSRLSREEARDVRGRILRDILEPLDDESLAYAVLVNFDLAASPELPEEEGENEILAALRESTFLAMVPRFIGDGSLTPDRSNRLLGKIAFRLNQMGGEEGRRLLTAMFDAGLLGMDNLPLEVQEQVVTIRLAASYRERKEDLLAALASATDPGSYRARVRPAALMVPYLIEQGSIQAAEELAALLAAHAREGSARSPLADEAVGAMVEAGALKKAAKAFLAAGREEYAVLGRFLSSFGNRSLPFLTGIIRETEDPGKRKLAAEILLAAGREGQAALIESAADAGLAPEAAALVIRALGEVEDEEASRPASEAILRRKEDAAPGVRRAALHALCMLSPRDRFDVFHSSLEDPDDGVRLEAIRGLGLSGDEKAIPLLRGMVEREEQAGATADWAAAASAVDALGHAAGSIPSRREEILHFLLDLALRAAPAGPLARFKRRRPRILLLALAYALARTGGEPARAVLARLSRDRDRDLAAKAASLLSLAK